MEPKRFTTEQLQQKYSSQVTASVPNASKKFTPQEMQQKYSNAPVEKKDGMIKTFLKDTARLALSPVASLKGMGEALQGKAPTGITTEFTGNVRPIGDGFDVTKGLEENKAPLKDTVGKALEFASFIPVAKGVGVVGNIAKQPFKQTAIQSSKALAKEGVVQGGLGEAGRSTQRGDSFGDTIYNTATGVATGGLVGGALGPVVTGGARLLRKTPENVISESVDKGIRKLHERIGTDVTQLETSAFKTKKAFELLNKEADSLVVPDTSAPLGSGKTKKFDINNTKDLVHGVVNIGEKIVANAREAVKNASKEGLKIDTNDVVNLIKQRFDSSIVGPKTANVFLKQIKAMDGDPEKIFDWVQNVNKNWKSDMTKSSQVKQLAEDIAQKMRVQLDTITDRVGYSEAYGNNQELKKLLIKIAKKGDKKFNVGSLVDDAAIDTAFATLTGQPAYLARSIGSVGLKAILNKMKSNTLKSVVKNIGKIPTETKLPSTKTKGVNVPINQPSRKAIDQGTEIVPRINKANAAAVLPVAGLGLKKKEEVKKTKNGTEVRDMHPKFEQAIKEAYEAYPNTPKGLLEAILMKESSAGYNKKNYNKKIGEYAWIGGLTDIAKKDLKMKKYNPDFNSIGGAVNSIAKIYELRGKGYTPEEFYKKRYSSGKLPEADIKKFSDMVDYYSNKK